MGFRFRRSTRLGPLRFNYRFAGLRLRQRRVELDLSRRAGSLVQHLSELQRYYPHHAGAARHGPELEREVRAGSPSHDPCWESRRPAQQPRLRPGQLNALKQELLALLRQGLFAPGSFGALLWEHARLSRRLVDGTLSLRTAGLLALSETPEAIEGSLVTNYIQNRFDYWISDKRNKGTAGAYGELVLEDNSNSKLKNWLFSSENRLIMKVKLTWTAQNQGRRETVIDADNVPGAEAQLETLYGRMPDFVCLGANIITEPRSNQEPLAHAKYINIDSNNDNEPWISEPRSLLAYILMCTGSLAILLGLFLLPAGLILMILGVLLTWAMYKWESGDWD